MLKTWNIFRIDQEAAPFAAQTLAILRYKSWQCFEQRPDVHPNRPAPFHLTDWRPKRSNCRPNWTWIGSFCVRLMMRIVKRSFRLRHRKRILLIWGKKWHFWKEKMFRYEMNDAVLCNISRVFLFSFVCVYVSVLRYGFINSIKKHKIRLIFASIALFSL